MKHFRLAALLMLSLALTAAGAKAQTIRVSCQVTPEMIVTLQPSRLGVPTVWDAIYGKDDKMIQFYSGVKQESGTVMAVGRVLSAADFTPENLFLAELNRRGRVLNEKMFPARDGEVPVRMLAVSDGYLVLSNVRGGKNKGSRWMRLSWYNKQGGFRREQILKDGEYHLDGQGLIAASENDGGFIVIAHAVNIKSEDDQHGMLMRFASGGQQLWKRAYRPGIPNQIHSMTPLSDGNYVAAGRIRVDDGRRAGWVMKLGFDGTVLWQRTFPRGRSSVIKYALSYGNLAMENGGYVLFGDVEPLDGGPVAAWVMASDYFGEVLWQRYLRRPDTGYMAAGLMRETDGRLTAVLNALAGEDSGQRDHVRILTLSSLGTVIGDEAYIEGIEAQAHDFLPGWNGERIVIATIVSDGRPLNIEMVGDRFVVADEAVKAEAAPVMGPVQPEKQETKKDPVQAGWIFVGTALDPYEDPCLE